MLEVRESAPDAVSVIGTVDLISGGALRVALHAAVERAMSAGVPTLEVDLHGVEFVDAAGLGILLGAHRRARRAGLRLRLVRPSPALARVLVLSRLYRVLDVQGCDVVDLTDRALSAQGTSSDAVGADAVPPPRERDRDDSPLAAT
jgi:anti-anti-sigma factor